MLYCQSCGAEARSTYKFCPVCGKVGVGPSRPGQQVPPVMAPPLPISGTISSPPPSPQAPPVNVGSMQYAGFWRRAAAFLLDGLFINLLAIPLVALSYFLESEVHVLLLNIPVLILVWLYHALLESGPHQATWGKRIMSLVVSDMQGQRPSFGRTSGRFFSSILSILILYLGYFMSLFTERRQTLHDKLAGTVVLYRGA